MGDVKGTVEALISVAADELKKNGSFKIAGALNLKLKKKPANTCAQGCQPIHERTLRLQSQAGIQDREGTPDEKAQRVDQLMTQTFCGHCTEDSRQLVGQGGRSHQAYSRDVLYFALASPSSHHE